MLFLRLDRDDFRSGREEVCLDLVDQPQLFAFLGFKVVRSSIAWVTSSTDLPVFAATTLAMFSMSILRLLSCSSSCFSSSFAA